jgi:hypothetical protein
MGWQASPEMCPHEFAEYHPSSHEEDRFSWNNIAFLRSKANPWQ